MPELNVVENKVKDLPPKNGKTSWRSLTPKKVLFVLYLLFLCVVGLIGISCYLYYHDWNLAKTVYSKDNEISQLKTEISTSKVEIESMKRQIEVITSKDDQLSRDIQLYIKTKYKTVPKEVAKAIAEYVVSLAPKYGFTPTLIVGVMQVESIFQTDAVSKKGAIGLMQVMPEWAPKLGLKSDSELYDIGTNIESGCRVLRYHTDEDGKGSLIKGLYYYVNKDSEYVGKVYKAVGQFVVFRSTVDSGKQEAPEDNGDEKEESPPPQEVKKAKG